MPQQFSQTGLPTFLDRSIVKNYTGGIRDKNRLSQPIVGKLEIKKKTEYFLENKIIIINITSMISIHYHLRIYLLLI